MNDDKKPPGANRRRGESAAGKSGFHRQYTTVDAGRQVYNAQGRVVGEVRDGVLRKSVRASVHFLRKPPAIAWDRCILEHAQDLGATQCEVRDLETGTTYTAPLSAFDRFGLDVNRGHGPQIALALEHWHVRRPGEPAAVQMALVGLEGRAW